MSSGLRTYGFRGLAVAGLTGSVVQGLGFKVGALSELVTESKDTLEHWDDAFSNQFSPKMSRKQTQTLNNTIQKLETPNPEHQMQAILGEPT